MLLCSLLLISYFKVTDLRLPPKEITPSDSLYDQGEDKKGFKTESK